MHRVRVGAIGLACVFLFVMLATAFLRAAGDPSMVNGNAAATATANDSAQSSPQSAPPAAGKRAGVR
jgi:hypothetical protein